MMNRFKIQDSRFTNIGLGSLGFKYCCKGKRENVRGFTIIETLVAITVLMIAVAGPLVVASKGLSSALYARDQIIASFLAQESMEVIKNQRDNNMLLDSDTNSVPWLTSVADNGGSSCLGKGQITCDASGISANSTDFKTSGALDGYPIYFDDGSGYTNVSGGSPTIFKRYYYLTKPTDNSKGCEPYVDPDTDYECRVNVVVTWNEGTVPYEVDLSSEVVFTLR